MPKALDQEHKSALSMSARPVSFATLKTYTTRRDTTDDARRVSPQSKAGPPHSQEQRPGTHKE